MTQKQLATIMCQVSELKARAQSALEVSGGILMVRPGFVDQLGAWRDWLETLVPDCEIEILPPAEESEPGGES